MEDEESIVKKFFTAIGYGIVLFTFVFPVIPIGLYSAYKHYNPDPPKQVTNSNFTEANLDSIPRTDDFETERSYSEYGDMDCSDFGSQEEAQEFFESEGGPDEDYHNLDRDGDGWVCESL